MSAKVFINYRRSGDLSPHVPARLYDRLCKDLGKDHVFMDVDRIPLGRNYIRYLREQIEKCDYVLALMGPQTTLGHTCLESKSTNLHLR